MAYDQMGNYTGFDDSVSEPVNPYDYEDELRREEELRRQLEAQQAQQDELASQVSHKQEITTMGDGSQVEKTTRKIPSGGAVNPGDYNASIAQQESGNNPNIGYHNRELGTASGMYGMTDAGYADARRANPNLPEDRLQSSPEQQTQAMTAYTQQNARYLQNYGVEPTENNLAAAHFLGAKGLSDYLKTGQISEAAARANGGADNVRRIVDQRLGGSMAAASGAAQPPQPQPQGAVAPQALPSEQPAQSIQTPMPAPQPQQGRESGGYIDQYQTAQDNPESLMKLSSDERAPDFIKERARNRAADLITQQRELKNAQEKISTATPTELAKYLRDKTTGGSWIKAIFYATIGAKQLAQEEGAKLGIGSEKVVMDSEGRANIVKVSTNGTPLEGYSAATGKKLSAEELISAVGGGAAGKVSTPAETYSDKDGNLYRSQSNESGRLVMRNAVTNEIYKGDPTKLKRERDVAGAAADERKQGFKRENDTTSFANNIRRMDYDSKLKAVAEFRQAAINRGEPDLTDAELSAMGVNRPDLGQPRAQGAAPQTPAPAQPAPGAAPMPQAQPQGAVAPAAPAQPMGAVAPTSPSVSGRMSVSEANSRREDEKSLRETRESAAKKIAGEAGEAIAASPQTIVNMNKIDKSVKHLDAGKTNFGAAGGGLRKGELSGGVVQEAGRFFNTEDSRNTQDVIEAINGVVLERANLGKMTDADLKFYTAGKPTVDDSPERVKEWLATAKEDIKNKLEFNKQQAASGGRKGPMEQPATPVAPPPSIPVGTSKIVGGVTYVHDGKGWKKQ